MTIDKSLASSRHYDGTQLVVETDLPDRVLRLSDIAPFATKLFIQDGAKPTPYYLDENHQWWLMSQPSQDVVLSMGWLIDLPQLQYRPRSEAKAFLCEVYDALDESAANFQATAIPECSVTAAISKLDKVLRWINLRDYEATIIVRANNNESLPSAQWWNAFESAGLEYGDGDMFWGTNDLCEEILDSYELFIVEPYTQKGYFKPEDRNSTVAYPDVAMSLRARDFASPIAVFDVMLKAARDVSALTGTKLFSVDGNEFDDQTERQKLIKITETLQSIDLNKR